MTLDPCAFRSNCAMPSFTSWKSSMSPWISLLSTSWYALGIETEKPHLEGQWETEPWQHEHKLAQACKVDGSVSQLFCLLILSTVAKVTQFMCTISLLSGNEHSTWKLSCTLGNNLSPGWTAVLEMFWTLHPWKGYGYLMYAWPFSKQEADPWMPLSINIWDFFSLLSKATLPCHCPFPSCMAFLHLDSKGNYLAHSI